MRDVLSSVNTRGTCIKDAEKDGERGEGHALAQTIVRPRSYNGCEPCDYIAAVVGGGGRAM